MYYNNNDINHNATNNDNNKNKLENAEQTDWKTI